MTTSKRTQRPVEVVPVAPAKKRGRPPAKAAQSLAAPTVPSCILPTQDSIVRTVLDRLDGKSSSIILEGIDRTRA